jgi:hypothetical protein
MGAHDIVAGKGKRIAKRIVHVGLCRKMQHGVNVMGFKNVIDQIGTANVPFDEFVIGQT